MTLRICYFGTYERDYDRNRIMMQALASNGVVVIECHEPVLEAIRHKAGSAKDRSRMLGLARRFAEAYVSLVKRYWTLSDHDVVIVGYLGHLDVFVARALCTLRRKPLVFDAFISLYDTLVHDRGVFLDGSLVSTALRALDSASCACADLVLLDTRSHAAFFSEHLGVAPEKIDVVLVGADPEAFHPVDPPGEPKTDRFTVLHYSKFAPLHGLPYILEAAKLLENEKDIRFLLVGGGQIESEIARVSDRLALKNVDRIDWMNLEELRNAISTAGACLGIFGDTDKAARVIPNKVYQAMAMGAPIITADTPAARELLVHETHALLCAPASPRAIADAVLRLKTDSELRHRIGANARRLYLDAAQPSVIGKKLLATLTHMVDSQHVPSKESSVET